MSEGTDPGIRIVDKLSDEEKNALLSQSWALRGPLYQLYSHALMIDYNPSFMTVEAWRHCDNGSHREASPPDLLIWSVQNLPTYIDVGWEQGILNEFNSLRVLGMPKDQVMEIVMFSQLYTGMRGLGHTYRAVGDFLPAWGAPTVEMEWPDDWAADPEAFRSGLDLSTREMTATDRSNLEGWYERNIGYVPKSIRFGLKYHPEFVKVNRAKWEVAIRTLPKQVAPLIMMRMNAVSQNRDGLRESALLSKAWGIERKYLISLLNGVAFYFAGFEGWYAPADSIEDVLDSMA